MREQNLHDRLFAEAEAWPLLSPKAFALRLEHLGWSSPGVLDRHTGEVAQELDNHLRQHAQGDSLVRLRSLRERAWFDEEQRTASVSVPLHVYLCCLAERHLEPAGAQVRLKERSPAADELPWARTMHWRWLSLRMPQDLLVSALSASLGIDPVTDRVSLVTPHLREVLAAPVAETHLHEKAAFSFSLLWTSWMAWLLRDGPLLKDADPSDSWPHGSPSRFVTHLQAAAITRFLLVGYLERRRAGQSLPFADICRETIEHGLERDGRQTGQSQRRRAYGQALRLLREGKADDLDPEMIRRVYRLLTGARSIPPPQNVKDIRCCDPIGRWMQASTLGALPETIFAARALRALKTGADSDFACFFWQYQRVRCQAYSFLTLEPGTAGLDWFQRSFNRLRGLRGDLDQLLTDAAVELESPDLCLGSLELRRSPPKEGSAQIANDLWKLAKDAQALQQRPMSPKLEVGLVFHFVKESSRPRGRGLHADPGADKYGVRFGEWTVGRRREAESLRTVLRRFPDALTLLRGVDVAGAELAVPTWPFVGLLRSVRDASLTAAHHLARPEIPPLRVTCHAGEEYRRLAEGLRRIHELVSSGVIRSGDRLGHGLALGSDPKAHHQRTEQPVEDRIDDLLWELERYRQNDLEDRWGRAQRVTAELREHIRQVYEDPSPDLDLYLRARWILFTPTELKRLGFPRRVALSSRQDFQHEEGIARHYLTSSETFLRGQRPIAIDLTEGELSFLQEAQRWLRQLLARMEVTVECNPSSNLLIGHLGAMEQHPVRTLTLGPQDGASVAPLMVSINTDDPITFATCLADEYAHLYLALLRQGLPSEEALAWADRVRRAAWRSRFTLRASTDPRWLKCAADRWTRPAAHAFEDIPSAPGEEMMGDEDDEAPLTPAPTPPDITLWSSPFWPGSPLWSNPFWPGSPFDPLRPWDF